MILGSYWVMMERKARERLEIELQEERKARFAAEARACVAEARLAARYGVAQVREEATLCRHNRLMAVVAEILKEKGVDPEVVDALLEL